MLVNDQFVLSYLDIFAKVGHAVAHDEHIPFTVDSNRLMLGNSAKWTPFDGKLKVTFAKVGSWLTLRLSGDVSGFGYPLLAGV